jgi:two-component system sensor histidine kinase DesK
MRQDRVVRANVKERLVGVAWAAAWMWPLLGPIGVSLADQVPHRWFALTGLAVFIAAWLWAITNAFDDRREAARPVDYVLLAVVAGVGVTLVGVYAGDGAGWLNVMLYVGVAGAAALRPAPAGAWVVSCIGVLVGFVLDEHRRGFALTAEAASVAFGMLLAGALMHIVKQMRRYIRLLRETRTQLARAAVAEERLRFARDLHDLLGHSMSLIVVKAQVVRRLVDQDPAVARAAAEDIERIGRSALADVRAAVGGYRAPELSSELDSVRAALADAGVTVRVRQVGAMPPAPIADVFALVVRESATNVMRHSRARTCDIEVTVTAAEATLSVRDDGRGTLSVRDDGRGTLSVRDDGRGMPGDHAPGVGLIGLAERLRAVGGELRAGGRTRGGFELVATVPVGDHELVGAA